MSNKNSIEYGEMKKCNISNHAKHDANMDMFDLTKLPTDIILEIFSKLHVKDVYQLLFVSKAFHKLASLNYYWWKKCMEEWFEPHGRPTVMTKKDSKLNWKLKYFKLTSPQPVTLKNKEKKVKVKKNWEVVVPTKLQMRSYYKSIRSKPKGKRQKDQKPTHYVNEFDNDYY